MKAVQAYWKELAAGVGIGVVIALAIWGIDVTPILVLAALGACAGDADRAVCRQPQMET